MSDPGCECLCEDRLTYTHRLDRVLEALHPYTQALLSAAPEPDPERKGKRIILEGDVPSPKRVPPGCSFHTRCPIRQETCSIEQPPLGEVAPGQLAACHFAKRLPSRSPDRLRPSLPDDVSARLSTDGRNFPRQERHQRTMRFPEW
ncbi:hypothetical protein CHY08_22980 (plasmid) [Rhizobium leguminosarum bv. viciae]|uniref:oligopeptide/dipeptide ABC transporter ATP-binding protein n=1 Tax=Rhizobium leguminosarum TaxID=384 RepID=UPI000B8CFC9E|nr:hypothetical protein CHY08_22980 [Rhizobium leguminosarum bv. viciae]